MRPSLDLTSPTPNEFKLLSHKLFLGRCCNVFEAEAINTETTVLPVANKHSSTYFCSCFILPAWFQSIILVFILYGLMNPRPTLVTKTLSNCLNEKQTLNLVVHSTHQTTVLLRFNLHFMLFCTTSTQQDIREDFFFAYCTSAHVASVTDTKL